MDISKAGICGDALCAGRNNLLYSYNQWCSLNGQLQIGSVIFFSFVYFHILCNDDYQSHQTSKYNPIGIACFSQFNLFLWFLHPQTVSLSFLQ